MLTVILEYRSHLLFFLIVSLMCAAPIFGSVCLLASSGGRNMSTGRLIITYSTNIRCTRCNWRSNVILRWKRSLLFFHLCATIQIYYVTHLEISNTFALTNHKTHAISFSFLLLYVLTREWRLCAAAFFRQGRTQSLLRLLWTTWFNIRSSILIRARFFLYRELIKTMIDLDYDEEILDSLDEKFEASSNKSTERGARNFYVLNYSTILLLDSKECYNSSHIKNTPH